MQYTCQKKEKYSNSTLVHLNQNYNVSRHNARQLGIHVTKNIAITIMLKPHVVIKKQNNYGFSTKTVFVTAAHKIFYKVSRPILRLLLLLGGLLRLDVQGLQRTGRLVGLSSTLGGVTAGQELLHLGLGLAELSLVLLGNL